MYVTATISDSNCITDMSIIKPLPFCPLNVVESVRIFPGLQHREQQHSRSRRTHTHSASFGRQPSCKMLLVGFCMPECDLSVQLLQINNQLPQKQSGKDSRNWGTPVGAVVRFHRTLEIKCIRKMMGFPLSSQIVNPCTFNIKIP